MLKCFNYAHYVYVFFILSVFLLLSLSEVLPKSNFTVNWAKWPRQKKFDSRCRKIKRKIQVKLLSEEPCDMPEGPSRRLHVQS